MLYTSSDFRYYSKGKEKLSISFLETRTKEIREEINELNQDIFIENYLILLEEKTKELISAEFLLKERKIRELNKYKISKYLTHESTLPIYYKWIFNLKKDELFNGINKAPESKTNSIQINITT